MSDRNISFFSDIPVELVVELGRMKLTLQQLASLDRDDVLDLGRAAGEPLDLVVGGRLVARAEMATTHDRVALRIVEIADGPNLRRAG
jgi:flagellar motor switch protein FliN/FliY